MDATSLFLVFPSSIPYSLICAVPFSVLQFQVFCVLPCLSTRCPQCVPHMQFGITSQPPVTASALYDLCPPHLLLSPDTPPRGSEFPLVVSSAPSLSPVDPSYVGAYRLSYRLNHYRCVSHESLCSQHPSPHRLVQGSQELKKTDHRDIS